MKTETHIVIRIEEEKHVWYGRFKRTQETKTASKNLQLDTDKKTKKQKTASQEQALKDTWQAVNLQLTDYRMQKMLGELDAETVNSVNHPIKNLCIQTNLIGRVNQACNVLPDR